MTTAAPDSDQPARRAEVGEWPAASQLIAADFQTDPQQHAEPSAQVFYVVWPSVAPFRTAAAVHLYPDQTAFVFVPGGDRSPHALQAVYSELRHQAVAAGAEHVLCLLNESLRALEPELLSHGFEYVGEVLTMECRTPPTPSDAEAILQDVSAADHDDRVTNLIQRTYSGSLSDPALAATASAAGFVARIRGEAADDHDRFIRPRGDDDAAICILSRYAAAKRIVVRYLGVAPEHRGHGLGRALLRDGLARIWSDAWHCAQVDVDEQNRFAVRIYESLGFRRVASAAEFQLPLFRRALSQDGHS